MVKGTAASTMLKRLDNERALKGVQSLSSIFQKAEKPAKEVYDDSSATHSNSGNEPTTPTAELTSEISGTADSSEATQTAKVAVAGASSPEESSEPSGIQGGEDEEVERAGARESPEQPKRRRRLVAVSDDEDDGDEENGGAKASHDAVTPDDVEEGEALPKASGDYIQGVSVVDGDVGSDSEADKAASVGRHSSDEEGEEDGLAEKGKKVRLEDYDDEEEFLLAGGDVEEAKTRKEWGLAIRNETDDAGEWTALDDKEARSKKAQEEKRRMYRESERRLRENKLMIRPAPVVKRSFKDLLAKVEARVAQNAGSAAPASSTSEQQEQEPSAPNAPTTVEAAPAPVKMVLMDEEDEDDDDDELVILGNTVLSSPVQPRRTVVSVPHVSKAEEVGVKQDSMKGKGEAHEDAVTTKKDGAMPSRTHLQIQSPPSARKKRANLRSQLLRTAQSRSEHLIAAERAGIKFKREAYPGFSREMNLGEQPDPFPHLTLSFIISDKFVGHKKGYVFKMDERGLGYYKDGGDKDGVEEEEEDVFHGVAKKGRLKLVSNSEGLENSDEEMAEPADDAVNHAAHTHEGVTRGDPAVDERADQDAADEQGVSAEQKEHDVTAMQAEEDDKPTVEKAKERTSIFRSFVGIEEGREILAAQALDVHLPDTAAAPDSKDTSTPAPAPAPTSERGSAFAAPRKYGQTGIAAMLRKQQESAKAATLLPVEIHESTKTSSVVWREPVLEDSDENDCDDDDGVECEGDDEALGEEESEEEDDDDDEEESEEEESDDNDSDKEEKPAKKKSLNDVVSIKKNTLRLGTMEAGYLRNEENALGYHEDVGIAKEDLEDGIDLMDTDNEDAEEEEEDSEEERRVAEGFIEDAKFAENLGLSAQEMQDFFQKQREEMDEKEAERILDIIRGDARRRKAAGQEDSWVPNRSARYRGMSLGQVPAGFSTATQQAFDDDLDELPEGDAAAMAARAAARMERLRWIAERKQLEAEQAQLESEEQAAAMDIRVEADGAAPVRRFNSRAAPSLAAFSRQLSGVFPSAPPPKVSTNTEGEAGAGVAAEETTTGEGAAGSASASAEGLGSSVGKRWTALRGTFLGRRTNSMLGGASLRGPGGQPDADDGAGKGKEGKEGKVSVASNYFFQKAKRDEDDKDPNQDASLANVPQLPPGASTGRMARQQSTTGMGFTKRKNSAGNAPMKRHKSMLLSVLND